MIDEFDALRRTRATVPPPNLAVRQTARSQWDDAALAIAAPPRSSHGARSFTLRAAIAAVTSLAIVAGAWFVTRARIDSVKPPHVVSVGSLTVVPATDPQVFLLVGSDSRAFVADASDQERFGDPASVPGSRSDSIILVRLDPKTHQALMVSIPRDLFVNVPGCGRQTINAAFDPALDCSDARGGAQLLVATVTRTLGVPVNHVIEVGFRQFASLVDELGGIRIAFPVPTRDVFSGLAESAGCTTLTGPDALAFVRSRHYETFQNGRWSEDPRSDLGRIVRQQLALHQLAAAAESHLDVDPRPLLRTLFANITVDSGFTADDALRYFAALRSDRRAVSASLKVHSGYRDGRSVLLLDAGAQPALDALAGHETPASGTGGTAIPGPSGTNPTAC